MTNAQSAAVRLRWGLLALACLCWLAGLFWLVNVVWPEAEIFSGTMKAGAGLMGVMGWTFEKKPAYLAVVGVYFGLFLLTQWFFLMPRGRLRLRVDGVGRPMGVAIMIAALMAGLLTMGLIATLLHITDRWAGLAFQSEEGWRNLKPRYWPPLVTLAVCWAAWAVVFFIYRRQGDHYTWAGKMIRGLIAGSVLELLVSGPAHVWVNRKEDCYCVQGSYTGLVLGGTVLLWCFGPGVALLFLRECERRERMAGNGGGT